MRTIEEKLRTGFSEHLYLVEMILYIAVGILLGIAASVAVVESGTLLWFGVANRTFANYGFLMLDRLLLVLMLVEILHTVRISIHSKEFMLVKPFLMVGLIASIRRVLVITIQATHMTDQNQSPEQAATAFRSAMVELGLLGFLVLVFALSIYWLDRTRHGEEVMPHATKRLA
ncbi:MAG TPA: phosphate-starvation-inducible PsiE family protein [Terriglobia bacterium]|nr:phosphate-starvation-inducible PsiE family protein [Terriglobia bacterium]